jgi:hypothetical protein
LDFESNYGAKLSFFLHEEMTADASLSKNAHGTFCRCLTDRG